MATASCGMFDSIFELINPIYCVVTLACFLFPSRMSLVNFYFKIVHVFEISMTSEIVILSTIYSIAMNWITWWNVNHHRSLYIEFDNFLFLLGDLQYIPAKNAASVNSHMTVVYITTTITLVNFRIYYSCSRDIFMRKSLSATFE